jgi:hypothetical protein
MKRLQNPNSFSFEKGSTKIKGNVKNKSLIILCYLRELRWLLGLIAFAIIRWLSG